MTHHQYLQKLSSYVQHLFFALVGVLSSIIPYTIRNMSHHRIQLNIWRVNKTIRGKSKNALYEPAQMPRGMAILLKNKNGTSLRLYSVKYLHNQLSEPLHALTIISLRILGMRSHNIMCLTYLSIENRMDINRKLHSIKSMESKHNPCKKNFLS